MSHKTSVQKAAETRQKNKQIGKLLIEIATLRERLGNNGDLSLENTDAKTRRLRKNTLYTLWRRERDLELFALPWRHRKGGPK